MSAAHSPVRSITRDRSAEGSSQGRQRKTSLGQRPTSIVTGSSGAQLSSSSRYQSSNLASTSHSSTIRRQSLFGTDDRVVLDIGSRVTKVGFSGEARPRDIFWSIEEASSSSQFGSSISDDGTLWTADILRCKSDEERKLIESKLKAKLTILFRSIFYQRLLIDPKQRKVILIENAMMPTLVKRTMCDVLFGNLQVPSVCFVASHLLSTLAIGRMTSIVLDLGHHEATLLPIQFGRGLTFPHLLTSSKAGNRLSKRLRALLLHYATFVPPASTGSFVTSHSTASGFKEKIPAEALTADFLDEIKAKALLVGDSMQIDEEQEEVAFYQGRGSEQDWTKATPFTEPDEGKDEVLMKILEERYKPGCKVTDIFIALPPQSREPVTPASLPSTIGNTSSATSIGRGSLLIPGWIRERAAEVLFEGGDDDDLSLTEMILTTLVKLPIDLRMTLANNIYIVGGTAMLPGLAHRLRIEIVKRLVEAEMNEVESKYSMISLSFPRVGAPITSSRLKDSKKEKRQINTIEESQEMSTSHRHPTGDDSYTTSSETNEAEKRLLSLESKSMRRKRREKERFQCAPISSLAPFVAVLNDHAPRIDADGQPVGGIAPSFPVNLSNWIGASLMGSLRVETIDQKTREVWDEEQEAMEVAKKAKKKKDRETLERPGLGAGRGSFLGTVSGLDLGTYGPLSAGALGKFVGANNPRSPPLP